MSIVSKVEFKTISFTISRALSKSSLRQTIEIFAAQHRYLDSLEISEIRAFLDKLWVALKNQHPEIIKELEETKSLSDELSSSLKEAIKNIKESLVK